MVVVAAPAVQPQMPSVENQKQQPPPGVDDTQRHDGRDAANRVLLTDVKAQHLLALPYVPLAHVLTATLTSEARTRANLHNNMSHMNPSGAAATVGHNHHHHHYQQSMQQQPHQPVIGVENSTVKNWAPRRTDADVGRASGDAPGGQRIPVVSVFVAQLPFDMPLETLQQLADEVVPGPSVRIVFAAPHLRNRRAYDGCAFLRMPEADAHRFVAALHKRVLFDVDGAWYAESEEQQTAIAAYCTWVQSKTNGERRRLLPRPTPYSPMTVEFAIKSSSRITRSRNVRH
jgi:hypothetical protein